MAHGTTRRRVVGRAAMCGGRQANGTRQRSRLARAGMARGTGLGPGARHAYPANSTCVTGLEPVVLLLPRRVRVRRGHGGRRGVPGDSVLF
jgi:hypothetical protein